MNTRKIGQFCESYVCEQLQKQGYCILARNFHVGKGSEIDIVAQKNNVIHFVEVKARSQTAYGLPREAVSAAKIRKIIRASEQFTVQYHTYDYERSYDVAEVYFFTYEQKIQIKEVNFLFQFF